MGVRTPVGPATSGEVAKEDGRLDIAGTGPIRGEIYESMASGGDRDDSSHEVRPEHAGSSVRNDTQSGSAVVVNADPSPREVGSQDPSVTVEGAGTQGESDDEEWGW
jgi:hypothetical protein